MDMKKLKCDLCDFVEQGETFDDWMKNLMSHYMEVHMDVMNDASKTKEDQQKWMTENNLRFDKA